MADLLALDPSIVSPGVALFRDGVLIAAATVKFKVDTTRNDAERCIIAADAVMGWTVAQKANVDAVAHEWPQIYTAVKSKGNPNELLHMVGVNLAVDTVLMVIASKRSVSLTIRTYHPAEWTGQCPKTLKKYWSSPRGKRIRSRLSDAEWSVCPDEHDAGDAIGIGLKALGRYEQHRVLSNGR